MAILGYNDLKGRALPSLWDQDYLKKLELQGGRMVGDLLNEVQGALSVVNGDLINDPMFAGMLSVADEAAVEYAVGSSNSGVVEITDHSTPDPYKGVVTGHMLPLKDYARALGWTELGLRRAREATINADVRAAVRDIKNSFQQQALARFFKMEGETVGSTSNASVPLADGGTTDSSYVPFQSPDGETFTSAHDHFLRQASVTEANVSAALEHLQEHGHNSPFTVIISRSDIATWTALSGFKSPEWPQIRQFDNSSGADRAAGLADIERYIGYLETDWGIAQLWATPRVPANYYAAFKSYGTLDPRNPLRLRVDPATGYGWNIMRGQWVNMPHHLVVLHSAHGFGIGEDRTNGVAVYIAGSGDYTTPTIS